MLKTRSAITFGQITLGLSAFLLTGTAIGVTQAGIAAASSRDQSRAEKHARAEAADAQTALAKGKLDIAIAHAEAAVRFQPQAAAYRVLLGQSYLKAGRFNSARDAFADALTLDDRNGKAALHFALAEIATGDWAGARKTLDAHADTIPVSDRGLAMALAGDPAAAVELLTVAARAPDADAKTRQNLGLSLALAGRWKDAQTVVAIDLAPADVDARITQWATFSRPKSASDQVAALLGVTPAADPGLPVALALNGAVQAAAPAPVVAAADPIDAYMPKAPVAEAPTVAAPAAPVQVADATPAPGIAGVVFGERREVVQPLPAASLASARPVAPGRVAVARVAPVRPVAVAAVKAMPVVTTKGSFFVQLGAYQNVAVARDAWGRANRAYPGFAGQTPQGMSISTAAGSFYRLSVGGFARAAAVAMCAGYRAHGGKCFVRAGAGDQVAAWAKGGRQLASR